MMTTRKILIFLLVTALLFGLMTLTASAASAESDAPYDDGFEDGFEYDYLFSEGGARIYLAVVGALLGIALPAVPLTIFLVKLIKRRSECEFIDYAVIVLSALWLAVGTTLFIFLL